MPRRKSVDFWRVEFDGIGGCLREIGSDGLNISLEPFSVKIEPAPVKRLVQENNPHLQSLFWGVILDGYWGEIF